MTNATELLRETAEGLIIGLIGLELSIAMITGRLAMIHFEPGAPALVIGLVASITGAWLIGRVSGP